MIFDIHTGAQRGLRADFEKGLKIYQNNLLMTAARVLSLSYPVLEKMLGHDALVAVAREYLQGSPPQAGDWAEWGDDLARWIDASALSELHPYLSDVARLEWLVHRASRARAAEFDQSSLVRLSDESLETVRLRAAPSLGLLRSVFPVDVLWQAHQPLGDSYKLDESALAEALNQSEGDCYLLVYQKHQVARISRLSLSEYEWLRDVMDDMPLAELLDRHAEFDFINWLPKAIQEGWLEGLT